MLKKIMNQTQKNSMKIHESAQLRPSSLRLLRTFFKDDSDVRPRTNPFGDYLKDKKKHKSMFPRAKKHDD